MFKKYFLITAIFLGVMIPGYNVQAEMQHTDLGVTITKIIQPFEKINTSDSSPVVIKKNLPATGSKSSMSTSIVGVLCIILASGTFLMRILIREEEKEHV